MVGPKDRPVENLCSKGTASVCGGGQRREDAPPPSFITQSDTVPACLCGTTETEKAQRALEMTTGCMTSTLEPEHRLMTQESKHYKESLEILVDSKPEIENDKEEEEQEALGVENQDADQKKKPRRKDTPVHNSPPHIPGVRLLKAEKQMVHLEDEEKDVKD